MKASIAVALVWGCAAWAGSQMPAAVKNDPCVNECQGDMRKAAMSCHKDKECFQEQNKKFTDCIRTCSEKRHEEKGPQCKNDKGKMVPCSELHPKKPEQ